MDKKSRLSILKNFKKFELLELIEHHFSVEELQKFCYCKNRNQILKVIKNTFSLEELQEIFTQHFGCEINDYCLEKFEIQDFEARILEKQNKNDNLAIFNGENLQNQIVENVFENENIEILEKNNDKLDFENKNIEILEENNDKLDFENEINANIEIESKNKNVANLDTNNDKLDFEDEINANIEIESKNKNVANLDTNNDAIENDKKHIFLPKEELDEVTIKYNDFYEKYKPKPFFESLLYLNKICGNNKSYKNKGKRRYGVTLKKIG